MAGIITMSTGITNMALVEIKALSQVYWYECPNCEFDAVSIGNNYCSMCGAKIKWS